MLLPTPTYTLCHWRSTVTDGPRTIDLDILLYDDAVLDMENLTVPHIDSQRRLLLKFAYKNLSIS